MSHMLLKSNHMYDPLARVPLIIKQPGRSARAGSLRDHLVNTIDVAPTILRAAGIAAPATMRGLDLADAVADREVVFCETRQHVMARTRTRKLIYDSAAPTRSLFFDLETDPLEMKNLFGDSARQGEIAALVRAVEGWRSARLAGNFMDENAPQIKRPNVPPHDQTHRDEMAAWYARQMQQWRAANGK